MKQEHHDKKSRLNNLGVNADNEKLFVGATEKGLYLDNRNGRVRSIEGDDGDSVKIKGEVIVIDSGGEPGDWINLVSTSINDRIFEVWVEETPANGPIFRIDGVKEKKNV